MKEIFSRRSIRRFTDEAVTAEQLEKLLRAAMQAPSACNEQPWEFIVIRNKETMNAIRRIQPFTRPLMTADCAVVVCGDVRRQRFEGFWVEDCSAAMQNLLLEAEHLGLGAVWMGLYPMMQVVEKIKPLLNLPEEIMPLGIAAVGHPAVRVESEDRFRPERIHLEKW